jgi:hypothetical protein
MIKQPPLTKALILLLCLFSSTLLLAQTPKGNHAFSVKQAVEYASKNNVQVKMLYSTFRCKSKPIEALLLQPILH